MRSSNPALTEKSFEGFGTTGQTMTIQGVVNKSVVLLFLVFSSAAYTWHLSFPTGWGEGVAPSLSWWYFPCVLAGIALGVYIVFNKHQAPFLAPVYALLEGLILGVISALFEFRYPGIVMQAVMATMGTFFVLLMAYKSGLIKATENFKLGVVAATGGIAVVYLIDLALMFFGMRVPFIHESGPLGIAVSFFITGIAALNLVLDFDFIEKATRSGAPKHMEWYSAFGLLVTLIWLYLEILRLLAKLRKK